MSWGFRSTVEDGPLIPSDDHVKSSFYRATRRSIETMLAFKQI